MDLITLETNSKQIKQGITTWFIVSISIPILVCIYGFYPLLAIIPIHGWYIYTLWQKNINYITLTYYIHLIVSCIGSFTGLIVYVSIEAMNNQQNEYFIGLVVMGSIYTMVSVIIQLALRKTIRNWKSMMRKDSFSTLTFGKRSSFDQVDLD